jgi:ribosomal protein S18 acetylase RimI-like enzyme
VSAADVAAARSLFLEYQHALGVNLEFQGFTAELERLPGNYSPPSGELLLLRLDGVTCGCVGIRRLTEGVAEMKRLFVQPQCRGAGHGKQLAMAAIAEAKRLGYRELRLDTLPMMEAALGLYRSLGFRETKPYYDNPIAGSRFLTLALT